MVHQYKNNGYNIVLDVCSGSVHVVDDLVYDIIAEYNKLVKGLGGARTFTQFYEELEEVRAGADEHGLEILEDVEGYVENLRSEYEA